MYFAGRLKETNGEQEYSYDHIIEAETLEDAEEIYDKYARTFYSDDEDPESLEYEDGGYYFLDGAIHVEIVFIGPTTKKAWMEEQFNMNLLTKKRH